MKTLLFVGQYYYPELFKGNDVVGYLNKHGYKCIVITGNPNYPDGKSMGFKWWKYSRQEISNIEVHRLPQFYRKSSTPLYLLINYLSFFISSKIFCFFFNPKVDVIFTQQLSPITSSIQGSWYKQKLNKPLITWVLDIWPESLAGVDIKMNKFILNYFERISNNLYWRSDKILLSSEAFKKRMSRINISSNDVSLLHNWAEDIFERNRQNLVFRNLPDGFKITFAGNLGEAQDLENVINAARITPSSVKWIFVGSGRYKTALKETIQTDQCKNLFLFDRHSLDYMPSLYSQSDLALVTLKQEGLMSETIPAKVMSYMAMGVPIVGMLNGDAKELINRIGCGKIVDAGDYLGLSDSIKQLMSLTKSELKSMGQKGKNYYMIHFSREMQLKKLLSLIEEIT